MQEIISLLLYCVALRPDWLVISRHIFSQSAENKAKYDFNAGDLLLSATASHFGFALLHWLI